MRWQLQHEAREGAGARLHLPGLREAGRGRRGGGEPSCPTWPLLCVPPRG